MTAPSWEHVRLGDALRVRYGRALPPNLRAEGAPVPVVGSAGVMAQTNDALVAGPAIIIGRKGNVGAVHLCESGAWPTDTTYYVLPSDHFDARFLAYQLRSLELRQYNSSTAVPSLRRNDLEERRLVRPPVNEQRRIVEILEDHLSRLDAACLSLKVGSSRSRSLFSSQLAREFRTPSGVDTMLGAVAQWGSGGTPRARTARFYEGGEIPWVVSGDLKDEALRAVTGRITQEGLKQSSAKWVPSGALLVAMYGATIGRLATTVEPVTTNQAVAHALPHEDIVTTDYLFWFLVSQRRLLVAAGQGGAQPNISQTVLKAWPIRIRSLREQADAVLATRSLHESTLRIQSAVQELLTRQAILRRALFAAAFAGRLTGSTADDEVVEELVSV